MRKASTIETGKIITMIILLMSISIKAYAQSPYAIFGDDSKMLEAKIEPVPSIYRVGIQSPNGANFYADFDLNKGLATLYDTEGNILRQDSISEDAKAMFTSIDPHAESYYHLSPYSYCGGNPVNAIDPDGRKIIFINGKIGGGSPPAGAPYWNGVNSSFVKRAQNFFNDRNVSFSNTDYDYLSSASQRRNAGYDYAKSQYSNWTASMKPNETFRLVSHSMGGAFSMGIEDYIKEQGRDVDYNVMINTYQVDRIKVDDSSSTFYIDYQNTNDPVLFWFDINLGYGELQNANLKIREKSNSDLLNIHRSPIDTGDFWKMIENLMQ